MTNETILINHQNEHGNVNKKIKKDVCISLIKVNTNIRVYLTFYIIPKYFQVITNTSLTHIQKVYYISSKTYFYIILSFWVFYLIIQLYLLIAYYVGYIPNITKFYVIVLSKSNFYENL